MQNFMPTRFFVFKIHAIKNGFAGPKSFRSFRETGPWDDMKFSDFQELRIENVCQQVANVSVTQFFS